MQMGDRYMVMTREKDAYSIGFDYLPEAEAWYDEKREAILNDQTHMYGYVLVDMVRTCVGLRFLTTIDWNPRTWWWRPRLRFRFGFMFAWLGLLVKVERHYDNLTGRVLRDHLTENGGADDA